MKTTIKDDEVDDNIIPFERAKIITGSSGSGSDNWLAKIEPNTVIVVSKKPFAGQPQEPLCMEYVVIKHMIDPEIKRQVTLLYSDLNPPPAYLEVITDVFSKITELLIKGPKKDVD